MDKKECSIECLYIDVYIHSNVTLSNEPLLVMLGPNIVPILHISEIFLMNYHYWLNIDFALRIFSMKFTKNIGFIFM